ncbi:MULTISPECIES: hypothetical protein [unclassified Cellulophaga]|uniref:hypothetical protein n=1 Tax=unclassified Cellulophaga TaxID=2634405 RepID=UPI0026E439A8|nr:MULTISPECIES: hypothetical protein [unclassified Cellulophaga]MDO6490666.1 hypothetical protein [Cellulophaga sp. 2_MG-2023]MDO6494140.1 hypothetical protein [Cellulophaga sp. 3_MG-2023]
MIKKSILLLCFIFCVSCKSAQHKFPSFDDVVTTFFTSYDLRKEQGTDEIRFVKKQEGYYIQEYNYDTNDYKKTTLFWSASNNTYQELNFPKGKALNAEYANYHLTYYYKERFNVLPYYGYVGWAKDVIAFLEHKKDLTDLEYYALGRAYSASASHLLNNSYEFGDTKEQFKFLESGKNQFTKEQLKTYINYEEKAIENYTILCQKNPDYPTVVGTICNKLDNEYVDAYLNLSIYQNQVEALAFLPDGLYTDFVMDYAKNYLNSLEPNAILFTTGDNDTFPFMYAQAKLKHRQDVAIVNTSLLNQNSYVNHLRDDMVLASSPIRLTLKPDAYAKENLSYVVFDKDKNDNKYLDLKSTLQLINAKDSSVVYKKAKENAKLSTNKIAIAINQDTLKLKYKTNYIVKGELLALDIIASNIKTRPVYCTFNELPVVSNYLEKSGFAYKITANPKNKIENDNYVAGIDADKTYAILVDEFQYHKNTKNSSKTELSVLINYTSSFETLTNHYKETGDIKRCKEVLDAFTNFYPKDLYADISFMISSIAKNAYAIKDFKNGDLMVENLIENLERIKRNNKESTTSTKTAALRKLIFGDEVNNKLDKNDLELYLYIITEISNTEEVNTNLTSRLYALKKYFMEQLSQF